MSPISIYPVAANEPMRVALGKGRLTARILTLLAGAALAAASIAAAPANDRSLYTPDELAAIARHAAPLSAPPADPTNKFADDKRAAALGQFLFFDKRFSAGARFSCASCHQPARAFTDGRKLAKAIAVGTRNAPTLLDAADNHWFFWDGRADTLWAQPLQVIENPREFGGDRLAVAHTIYDGGALRHAYEEIFGKLPPLSDRRRFPTHARPDADKEQALARAWDGMTAADRDACNRIVSNVGKALAAYERRLVGRDSPFDRYARALQSGDRAGQTLLSASAKRGLKLFVGRGHCDLCHSGPDFTDGQFHNVGLPVLAGMQADPGRAEGIRALKANPFNAAGRYSDQPHGPAAKRLAFLPAPKDMLGAFKTPSLRNVARTAPYLHDGRFATLRQVVQFYADGKKAGRGKLIGEREGTLDLIPHFTPAEVGDLVAFLKTLNSAALPPALTRRPAAP
jgi:cytochrome c peroxidase